jgi:hypothetical protein
MRPALRETILSRRYALVDQFQRPDTSAGDIGGAPTGQRWSLHSPYVGAYPLPASTAGLISGNKFVVPTGDTVYAEADLAQTVRRLEVEFSWVDLTTGTDFTTLAVIISSSPNLIDTMLHTTVTNGVCNLQKRVAGGAFVTLNSNTTISPSLALANARHKIVIEVLGNRATVTIDGSYVTTAEDVDISSVVGKYIVVEHFSSTTNVRWPLTIYSVKASY